MRTSLFVLAGLTAAVPSVALACDDIDGDGYEDMACGGNDCDDADATSYPSAPELCDGVDNDCDGIDETVDPDGGATVVVFEDFEAYDGGFSSSAPSGNVDLWEYGAPTSGPLAAYSGDNVWATVLAGDYDAANNAANLDMPGVSLPAAPVELRYAYWQDLDGDCAGDFSRVVVIDNTSGFETTVDNTDGCSGALADSGGGWVQDTISLDPWAGGSISVRWTLETDSSANAWPGIYLDDARIVAVTDVDDDGWSACGDCDDADPLVSPDGVEVCDNGLDDDCLDGDQVGDGDGDGVAGPACGGLDCDDDDPNVWPGATEVCDNGVDDDCGGDGDGIGDVDGDGVLNVDCGGDDCDDANIDVYPGAPEICGNGDDDDCDASTPDVLDVDADGFGCDVDCDDADAAVYPGAVDLPCNGKDDDCDPATSVDPDEDGDGATCGLDCDDADPLRSPDFDEVCDDGIDNDCNPSSPDLADADGDGFDCLSDCDDADPQTRPGAPELCADGIDQDCDSEVDEPTDELLTLDDDGSAEVSVCAFDFPLCGQDWNLLHVQANGRITFGFDDGSSSGLGFFFVQQSPEIALLWSDLDPAAGGTVEVVEDVDLVTISWTDVPSAGSEGTASTFSVVLTSDGFALMEYGSLDQPSGLAGFSCGPGDSVIVDFSDDDPTPTTGTFGSGTESALYEEFDLSSNPVDLADLVVDLCLTAGEDTDGDGWTDACGDCDDGDAGVFPGAVELCDLADQDCDGQIDELDADGDGHVAEDCAGDDCDDDDPAVSPSAEELCNGLDDDCDGEAEPLDGDEDGFGRCVDDCDDDDPAVFPDAEELCNGVDDDCDGDVDEGWQADLDGDGVLGEACGGPDCDDLDAAVHPGSTEACDGLDNDCDGVTDDVDADLDTWIAEDCGGRDCDDDDPLVNPDVVEQPYDGIDNDCDGIEIVDADGDGYAATEVGGEDCDDADPDTYPTAPELCDDESDNDCDGVADADEELCGCSCAAAVVAGQGGAALLLGPLALLALRRRRGRVARA